MNHKYSYQSGQIGVIILLLMVVMLTIGLSLASRSTQDLFLASQQAESTRVFNAAEAGIEQALSTDLTFDGDTFAGSLGSISDANVEYVIRKVNQLETRLFQGVAVTVDLSGSRANPENVQIDWHRVGANPASLAVAVYYDDVGTTRVRYYGLSSQNRDDGFMVAAVGDWDGYLRRMTFVVQPNDLFMRVWPVYNDTHVRIAGAGWTMPVQYYNVRSEATNVNGDETRIVEVNRTLSAAPSVMDFAVFSGTTLTK